MEFVHLWLSTDKASIHFLKVIYIFLKVMLIFLTVSYIYLKLRHSIFHGLVYNYRNMLKQKTWFLNLKNVQVDMLKNVNYHQMTARRGFIPIFHLNHTNWTFVSRVLGGPVKPTRESRQGDPIAFRKRWRVPAAAEGGPAWEQPVLCTRIPRLLTPRHTQGLATRFVRNVSRITLMLPAVSNLSVFPQNKYLYQYRENWYIMIV